MRDLFTDEEVARFRYASDAERFAKDDLTLYTEDTTRKKKERPMIDEMMPDEMRQAAERLRWDAENHMDEEQARDALAGASALDAMADVVEYADAGKLEPAMAILRTIDRISRGETND